MATRARGAGRPGSLGEARELVTLVSSLSEAGDSLAPEAVAERLGVSEADAEKLVGLVLSSTLASGVGLPLVEEDGALVLVGTGGVRGRRLRLGHAETVALLAALERIGVDESDPLRVELGASLSAEPIDEGLVRRLMAGEAGDDATARALATCGRAAAARRSLEFDYEKPGEATEHRHVVPLGLRSEDGAWYLDALDLDRRGERTFRVDRMTEACEGPHAETADGTETGGRTVRLTFDDTRWLDLLPWHNLRVAGSGKDGSTNAETPYYGGAWLPRMVAACGGHAHCDDPEVAGLARDYARSLLVTLTP